MTSDKDYTDSDGYRGSDGDRDYTVYRYGSAVNALCHKVWCESLALLRQYERGYQPDFRMLLEEVQLVDMVSEGRLQGDLADAALQFYVSSPEPSGGSIAFMETQSGK